MEAAPRDLAGHIRLGPAAGGGPVVIAVPHAGRHYPPPLLDAARLPRSALETIEDRHVDLLVADAVAAGATAIVARAARALVDLNRDPREIDPAILRGGAGDAGTIHSEKVAGGLGVVPSRIAAGGAVWKRPLDPREIAARLAKVHRPYHDAVAETLAATRRRHGVAVLLDLHSMPPLGTPGAQVVLGDLHGTSCAPAMIAAATAAARRHGLSTARNRPYAGGYTLARHGRPGEGIHAVQVEIDRALYLDAALHSPGPGLQAMRRLVAAIADALADLAGATPLAAE